MKIFGNSEPRHGNNSKKHMISRKNRLLITVVIIHENQIIDHIDTILLTLTRTMDTTALLMILEEKWIIIIYGST
jgi:hypothetical protein